MDKVLLVIPAYNEAENIERVINELKSIKDIVDYVIINDGSKDSTLKICMKNNYNYINMPVNVGLAGAFRVGMKYADRNRYKMDMQYDGDGQHDPKYIKSMMEFMKKENADIVIGSRFLDGKRKFSMRNMGNCFLEILIMLTTRKKITDPTSGMRLYNRRMIENLSRQYNFPPEPDTIVYFLKCGFKVIEYPVVIRHREAGESYLNIGNAIRYMINMTISIAFIQNFRKRG